MDNKRFIIIGGYLYSGSSAITDYLKEFEGFYNLNAEFRLISDPYGIKQLERALVDDWSLISSTAAISDFKTLCQKCCRPKSYFPFAGYGQGYNKFINKNFIEITEKYIEEISKFRYKADYYHFKSKKSYKKYVRDRILFGIVYYLKRGYYLLNIIQEDCYLANPTRDEFSVATKRYLDKLFEPIIKKKGCNNIILDQGISVNDIHLLDRYFNNAKMIIVDRDPRDIFIDQLIHRPGEYRNISLKEIATRFVIKQKAMHSNNLEGANILRIRFEDLVNSYIQTGEIIKGFLDLNEEEHKWDRKYFNPAESKKNIGLWKNYREYNKVYDIIYREMKSNCYSD